MATPPPHLPFRILDLPLELRERIYTILLVSEAVVTRRANPDIYRQRLVKHVGSSSEQTFYSGPANPAALNLPTITRVSRQTRQETLSIFFGRNRFSLPEAVTDGWIYQLDDEIIARMRRFRLEYRCLSPSRDSGQTRPLPSPRYTVLCDITLKRREPYFELHLRYEPSSMPTLLDSEEIEALILMRTQLAEVLQHTLARQEARSFSLVGLLDLYESWVLLHNTLFERYTKPGAATNIAKATRQAMEMRLHMRERTIRRKRHLRRSNVPVSLS